VRRRLDERVGQYRVIAVRGDQVAHGPVHLQDLVGGLLDLSDTLQVAHRAVVVLHADTQQRQRRDIQQLGQALDGVQLDHLALLVTIQGGPGDTETGGDLLRAETGFQAVRP